MPSSTQIEDHVKTTTAEAGFFDTATALVRARRARALLCPRHWSASLLCSAPGCEAVRPQPPRFRPGKRIAAWRQRQSQMP